MMDMFERSDVLQNKLELLVQTGLLLAKDLDLETIVQAATDAGLQLAGAEFGAFFYNVVGIEGESYLLHTVSGVDRERFAHFPNPRNTAVFGPTFAGTGVVRSGDITQDPRYGRNAPFHGMPEGHVPARSYLAVPVKAQTGEVLGGLFYGHAAADVFTEESETLVTTIAAQAATAIENHRLREQLRHRLEDLKAAEVQRHMNFKHQSELAAIVESSEDAIVSKDLNGIITNWNQAATRILGYTPGEIVGRSILTLIPEELHPEEETILRKIRSGERIEHFETTRVAKNGERLAVSLSISPVRDATGTIIGAAKILRDISSRRLMEKSLLQAEKIAATGRMAATIAHEINNPLEAVMNLLYLARSMAIDSEQRAYLMAAEGEVVRVSHLARQTLGFYRENASALLLSPSALLTEVVRIYEPKCRASNIRIESRQRSTRRLMLRQGELMQVLSNLVANAIYAMPHGGTLTLTADDVDEPEPGVRVVVADTGTGIAPEQMPRIFEAFYTTRSAIGTGIGLFVSRQFILGHGGTIEVQSSIDAADHGTKMSIFLPLENPYLTPLDA